MYKRQVYDSGSSTDYRMVLYNWFGSKYDGQSYYIKNVNIDSYCYNAVSYTHLVSALVFVTLLLHYDISLQALEGWCVAGILLACSFADLEGYIIPDRFIAVGVVLFITTLFFDPQPLRRALDGAIGGLAVAGGVLLLVLGMEKLLGREAMGGGDIKLLFLTGLFLGWKRNLLCLVAACVIGIVWGLLQKKRDGGEAIPWGPSIALGAWLTALCGQQIIDWYLAVSYTHLDVYKRQGW